jgi:hypothetical protein
LSNLDTWILYTALAALQDSHLSCILPAKISFVDETSHALSEVCNSIEHKKIRTEPIEWLTLDYEADLSNRLKVKLSHDISFNLYLDDDNNDVDVLRQLGRAMRNSSTITNVNVEIVKQSSQSWTKLVDRSTSTS